MNTSVLDLVFLGIAAALILAIFVPLAAAVAG